MRRLQYELVQATTPTELKSKVDKFVKEHTDNQWQPGQLVAAGSNYIQVLYGYQPYDPEVMTEFLSRYEADPDANMDLSDLYRRYVAWCSETKVRACSQLTLKKMLRDNQVTIKEASGRADKVQGLRPGRSAR